ncbi:hypothetical protein SAMN05216456_2833 [Devosia crocina]|uniref:Uncharacterized protein n=1 Tax=Devosia crocina TaxID=429728 RepID=A0A1I7NRF4_9HYPH|nr:hypothetical protein SAMN05216456_2833 [Devosia crocina]
MGVFPNDIPSRAVTTGLIPVVHAAPRHAVDRRDKPGNDGAFGMSVFSDTRRGMFLSSSGRGGSGKARVGEGDAATLAEASPSSAPAGHLLPEGEKNKRAPAALESVQ